MDPVRGKNGSGSMLTGLSFQRGGRLMGSRWRSLLLGATALAVAPALLGVAGDFDNCTGIIELIGDAWCDEENNNSACDYDGGDCCPSTCISTSSAFIGCQNYTKTCFDPLASDYNRDYVNCTGDPFFAGDGECNAFNNVPECAFDGGDCCVCTCVERFESNPTCGKSTAFNCLDPDAPSTNYDCGPMPPTPASCVPSIQLGWHVNDTAGASSLARAVNCSGGVFEVEWRGHVLVGDTMWVSSGTELRITGTGAGAVADCSGASRFLVAINSSVYLQGLDVRNGLGILGGAILAASSSQIVLNSTSFTNNSAESGGAVYVRDLSAVSMSGETTFVDNNAMEYGGALYVSENSNVSWMGKTSFISNGASARGGALLTLSSTVHSDGETSFSGNWGFLGGGGVLANENSTVIFRGLTSFVNNQGRHGGGLYADGQADISFHGETSFENNSAGDQGGATYVQNQAIVLWNGSTLFKRNNARLGGALRVDDGKCLFNEETNFVENVAYNDARDGGEGGGLQVSAAASISWTGYMTFDGNRAYSGGALFLKYGSEVEWSGTTSFIANQASSNGGAIGSSLSDSAQEGSSCFITGNTSFTRNTCDGNGGAIALNGALQMTFGEGNCVFEGNSALSGSGGAVFISATALGPVFENAMFVWNSAGQGGAVFSTGSGTAVTKDPDTHRDVSHSVTYEQCLFLGNTATATGGAVDSAVGQDVFTNTTLTRNTAVSGGALRMGGSWFLSNCSFVENASAESQGPAVSNIGNVQSLGRSSFLDNTVICPEGYFVDFIEGDRYELVCSGCPRCSGECYMEQENLVPVCTEAYEHSDSNGINVTIEFLDIEAGYWRATNTSDEILECYNTDACLGGITGEAAFCLEGYEGPYCSVCSNGYATGFAFTCTKCSETNSLLTLVLAVFCATMVLVVVTSHLVSKETADGGNRVSAIHRLQKRFWFQPIKIVIVVWQIVTQFSYVANVTYPELYQRFLDAVDPLSFDLGLLVSAGCLVQDVDFHDRLLISTLGPIALALLLGLTYTIGRARNRGSDEALLAVRRKHMSALLLMSFLVYASASSIIFSTFACEKLDDSKDYLRADYSIECDSFKHRNFMVYAVVMIFVYPIGVPLGYATLLLKNRKVLRDKQARGADASVEIISDLWKAYKPERYFYEVIECGRRISLTGITVFIYPNSAAQVAVTLMIAFAFQVAFEALAPYEYRRESWISRCGHTIVFVSMYVALLLKVDVSTERSHSQQIFAGVLVAAHACLALAAILEAIVVTYSLVREHVDESVPRRRLRSLRRIAGASKQEAAPLDDIDLSDSDP